MALKSTKPFWVFFLGILAISGWMFYQQWRGQRRPKLVVPANKGIASLLTLPAGDLLAAFQDGRAAVWSWQPPYEKKADWHLPGGLVAALSDGRLAVLSAIGDRRLVSIVDGQSGQREFDIAAGWLDQTIVVKNSPDFKNLVLMRQNLAQDGFVEMEWAVVDADGRLIRSPFSVSMQQNRQVVRDFSPADDGVVYVVGSSDGQGRLMAIDLEQAMILFDKVYQDLPELVSVAVSPVDHVIGAGDQKAQAVVFDRQGAVVKKVGLLLPGETRRVTNDYSALNAVFSPDGRYLGLVVAPTGYVVDVADGKVVRRVSAHKVMSKLAFSPDGSRFATADLRADGSVAIHTLSEQ